MILSTLALDILLTRPELRKKIAEKLDVTDQSVKAYRRENENDGPLTKHGIVDLIAAETGLSEEQILIEEPKTEVA